MTDAAKKLTETYSRLQDAHRAGQVSYADYKLARTAYYAAMAALEVRP